VSYRFSRKQSTAICSWIVTCCDGKEIQIDVPVNTFAVYCLDNPSRNNIIPNSNGGEWTTKELECDTNCGSADPDSYCRLYLL